MTRFALLMVGMLTGVFVITIPYSAQDRNKQESGPQRSVRQLHPAPMERDPPQGIALLPGYRHKSATDFEGNQIGEIAKKGGVKIRYEMGFSQGLAADPDRKRTYVWYREQTKGSRTVRFAMGKNNVFIISIPLGDDRNDLHAVNFYGRIEKTADISDMLLMILPFVYK